MAVLLSLFAALAYGGSDFAAGLASRRFASGAVTLGVEVITLLTSAVAVLAYAGVGPSAHVLAWGALGNHRRGVDGS